MTYGLVEWLRAVHKAPGTFPPLPDDLNIESLERNGWVRREGDGWKLTEATRTLGRDWFAED